MELQVVDLMGAKYDLSLPEPPSVDLIKAMLISEDVDVADHVLYHNGVELTDDTIVTEEMVKDSNVLLLFNPKAYNQRAFFAFPHGFGDSPPRYAAYFVPVSENRGGFMDFRRTDDGDSVGIFAPFGMRGGRLFRRGPRRQAFRSVDEDVSSSMEEDEEEDAITGSESHDNEREYDFEMDTDDEGWAMVGRDGNEESYHDEMGDFFLDRRELDWGLPVLFEFDDFL